MHLKLKTYKKNQKRCLVIVTHAIKISVINFSMFLFEREHFANDILNEKLILMEISLKSKLHKNQIIKSINTLKKDLK